MYVDTHCHLDDKRFDLANVIAEYERLGVSKVINVACNLQSSKIGQALSQKYESVYFAVGYHPSDVEDYNRENEKELIKFLSDPKCVAIGEIGLDYHWQPYDKEKQINAFISQLEIANSYGLPVSVHSRDATADMLNILKQNKSKLSHGGVMHCFSGSIETARELLKLGFMLGFGGTVTFKNSRNLPEVARFCPLDSILTETDSPYLSPEPFRGSINQPKNIPVITAFLAHLKGIDNIELADKIMNNAKRLFKI